METIGMILVTVFILSLIWLIIAVIIKKTRLLAFSVAIGSLAIIIILSLAFPTEEKPSPTKTQTRSSKVQSSSIEYMLATIDKGYVSRDDISIARFRSLLQQLDVKFVESKKQIGDMSVTAQNLLKEEGVKESLMNIMEGMNQLFSGTPENLKYAEYASAYVVLRSKGQSHDEAIGGLRAILQGLGIY